MFRNGVVYICTVSLVCCFCSTQAQKPQGRTFLGLFSPRCNGCPAHFCDDDPAIIHGYCCGCSGLFDRLPVQCSPHLLCPANNYELCEQYNYMLYCCC